MYMPKSGQSGQAPVIQLIYMGHIEGTIIVGHYYALFWEDMENTAYTGGAEEQVGEVVEDVNKVSNDVERNDN
jgi:hypothetical protein